MKTFFHNKLWRDKLPDILKEAGSIVHLKQLTDIEYDKKLRAKLVEESQEVVNASDKKEIMGELADIFEVVDALCLLHGIEKSEILAFKKKKFEERGGYYQRKFVTIAKHPEESPTAKYCVQYPETYPEI